MKAKKFKSGLSLLLSLVMLFSITAGIDLSAYAAGSTVATATSISLNTTNSGSITSTNEKDVYKFTLSSSGKITVAAKAYMEWIYYNIYDVNGSTIWTSRPEWNSDTGLSSISESIDLTKGTYYFGAVKCYGCTGNYNFKITFTSAQESFSETAGGTNNSITAADSISINTTCNGQIAVNDEKDIYKFTLSSSGKITVAAKAYMEWIYYNIYDVNGSAIWTSRPEWNSNTGLSSISESIDLTKGTYYFGAVKCYDCTGNYNFKITFTSAQESFSETAGGTNNSITAADSISINTTYKGQIALNDTQDLYKFTLSKATKIAVSATAYMEWIYYNIYDVNGSAIWTSRPEWNSNTGSSSISESIDLSKGTYYFGAVKCYDCTGNYTFAINCAHSYKKTVTKKATTSETGTIKYTCTVCGATKTAGIATIKSVTLSATTYTYDGKVKKPSVTVKDSKGNKIASSNYTVSYSSGRKNVGKYTVTIKFKGNYSGTVKKTFTIKPKNTSISKISAKSKGFTVKWKKYTTQTTGYQIQYSTSSKFSNAKTVTVSKNSTTSKTISKLKAKKKYYVRIRTYKTVSGTKYYSSWSKAKTVTTKK